MIEWEEKQFNLPKQGVTYLYLYTPMCGTCQVAKKMLSVVEALFPTISIYSLNLNYFPKEARALEIESVPCLLIFENEVEKERVYAFQSVGFLHELIKKYNH